MVLEEVSLEKLYEQSKIAVKKYQKELLLKELEDKKKNE